MHGVLSGLEGLDAFQDLMTHTTMKPWYDRVKETVKTHTGAKTLQDSFGNKGVEISAMDTWTTGPLTVFSQTLLQSVNKSYRNDLEIGYHCGQRAHMILCVCKKGTCNIV